MLHLFPVLPLTAGTINLPTLWEMIGLVGGLAGSIFEVREFVLPVKIGIFHASNLSDLNLLFIPSHTEGADTRAKCHTVVGGRDTHSA